MKILISRPLCTLEQHILKWGNVLHVQYEVENSTKLLTILKPNYQETFQFEASGQ